MLHDKYLGKFSGYIRRTGSTIFSALAKSDREILRDMGGDMSKSYPVLKQCLKKSCFLDPDKKHPRQSLGIYFDSIRGASTFTLVPLATGSRLKTLRRRLKPHKAIWSEKIVTAMKKQLSGKSQEIDRIFASVGLRGLLKWYQGQVKILPMTGVMDNATKQRLGIMDIPWWVHQAQDWVDAVRKIIKHQTGKNAPAPRGHWWLRRFKLIRFYQREKGIKRYSKRVGALAGETAKMLGIPELRWFFSRKKTP